MASRKNVFVTGRPGIGKTTLIRRVLDDLGVDAGGFYTHEIREGGRRVGFAITDLDGASGILARVGLASPFRVGRYGVNRDDLERIGVSALERAIDVSTLIVMDEIGRMELCSDAFMDAVVRALDSPRPVLGTIQDRRNPFLDSVRARGDVEVLRLTDRSRETMVGRVVERLTSLIDHAGEDE
jgi:nucleoside-triphosphatase